LDNKHPRPGETPSNTSQERAISVQFGYVIIDYNACLFGTGVSIVRNQARRTRRASVRDSNYASCVRSKCRSTRRSSAPVPREKAISYGRPREGESQLGSRLASGKTGPRMPRQHLSTTTRFAGTPDSATCILSRPIGSAVKKGVDSTYTAVRQGEYSRATRSSPSNSHQGSTSSNATRFSPSCTCWRSFHRSLGNCT